jgi:hypothetical protein
VTVKVTLGLIAGAGFAIEISPQGIKGYAHEINGRHCIGDKRILGLDPSLFSSDP